MVYIFRRLRGENPYMSLFNLATAAIPLYNAYKAYQLCNYKIPVNIADEEITNDGILKFALEFGVRGTIRVFSFSHLMEEQGTLAFAIGNQSIQSSDLAVYLDASIQQNYLLGNVIIRHEYTHIKKNDSLTLSLLKASVGAFMASVALSTASPFMALAATALATGVTHSCYSHFMENCADDEAFAHSSIEELHQMIEAMKQDQRNAIELRNQNGLLAKLLIMPSGDRIGSLLCHPTLSSRINKAHEVINNRNYTPAEI